MGTIRQKVALQGARFFAFHGFYDEEQTIGNEFIVDIEAEIGVSNNGNDDISKTVNYEQLYNIIANQMKNPRKLLETVAHAILEDVQSEFAEVQYIRVVVRKINPPLSGEVENSLVELVFSR
ncbi:MAG TPA: dihydroneopterin aldolase [Sphingobacteriaceae bacterium]|nr:dihydroneopterin aldolase [Sphingobacteriaceae bacterium]